MVNEAQPNPRERVRQQLGARVAAPTTTEPIEEVLASYEMYVADLCEQYVESSEILLILLTRDEIALRWTELTSAQRRRVEKLDMVLSTQHAKVADVLPNALSTDRSRWWWFLHEGPQVRAKAPAAPRKRGLRP